MDVRLKFLHEDGKDYLIRICMTVDEANYVSPRSVIRQCEECDTKVWYDTQQKIPTIPDKVLEREVILCITCAAIHGMIGDEPMKWADPPST